MSFWHGMWRVSLVSVIVLAVIICLRVFEPKLQEMRRLEGELERARADVQRTASQLRDLKAKQERLRTDPQYVEKVAREELGYSKPGETVFRFEEEED